MLCGGSFPDRGCAVFMLLECVGPLPNWKPGGPGADLEPLSCSWLPPLPPLDALRFCACSVARIRLSGPDCRLFLLFFLSLRSRSSLFKWNSSSVSPSSEGKCFSRALLKQRSRDSAIIVYSEKHKHRLSVKAHQHTRKQTRIQSSRPPSMSWSADQVTEPQLTFDPAAPPGGRRAF